MITITKRPVRNAFSKKVAELSGVNLLSCYQCGKCSAGCPSASSMDLIPSQVIKLAQLGLENRLEDSNTVWVCASCYTCSVRCPRGVDVAKVMEALRQITLRKNIDYVKIREMPAGEITQLPTIALVSNLRKSAS